YTLGPAPGEPLAGGDLSCWMGGIAVDRAFPLRSALLIADVFVEHPMREGAELRWTVEGGGRYQLDPFFALDIGVGRRMTGDDPAWFVTIGAARTFGIQSLIPIPGR